jgi:hypothetical protein
MPASDRLLPASTLSSVPSPGIPKHIPTWAYDEYAGPGAEGTRAEVQAYLTYAEGGFGNTKAIKDCGGSNACHSVMYFLDNFVFRNGACTGVYANDLFKSASESWFMHVSGYHDAAHRLIGYRMLSCKGVAARQPVYALNSFNAGVRLYERSYLRTYGDAWDYYLMDVTKGSVLLQFYGPGGGMCQQNLPIHLCSTTQEYPNDPTVVQAHNVLYSGLTHRNGSPMNLFFNGVTFTNGRATDLGIVQENKNVFGAVCEDCVVSLGTFRPQWYASILNAMAQMNAIPTGSFIQLNVGEDPAGSPQQIAERTISAAMTWLGYSPGHTVVFPDFEASTTRLAIWPEYSIVPTDPVESMSTSYSNLQVATGVYRREFRACYNYGVPIGQCAAIVNGNTTATIRLSAAWLKQAYGHVVELSGGDIPSGGHVLLTSSKFIPSATTLAPGHGILIAR